MAQIVIYPSPSGKACVSRPGPGFTAADVQARLGDVPSVVCDEGDLPSSPLSAWQFDGEAINGVAVIPAPEVGSYAWKAEKTAELAAKRYAVETGGVVWNGHIIQTDRESQAMLTGALVMQQAGFVTTNLNWKFADGFAEIEPADIPEMAGTVTIHVQSCFDTEATKKALIDSGEDPELESDWPSNT